MTDPVKVNVGAHTELLESLRLNAEMLQDGHQKNLTHLWRSEVVREAAKDSVEAADAIASLLERLAGMEKALRAATTDVRLVIADGLARRAEKAATTPELKQIRDENETVIEFFKILDTALSQPIEREGK